MRLVDLIRAGKAPAVIRRKGAEGNLPLPPEDKIEILAFLATAPEADLRAMALETLRGWDGAEVRRVMASPQTAPDVLRFAAEQLLPECEELRDILFWNPSLPADARSLLERKLPPRPSALDAAAAEAPSQPPPEPLPPASMPETVEASPSTPEPEPGAKRVPEEAEVSPGKTEAEPAAMPPSEEVEVEILAKLAAGGKIEDIAGAPVETPPEVTKHDDELTPKDRETLIEKIHRMSVVQKIKAALTGNMETRSLLIRDSNKIISRAVLQSPKISDSEAENYAAAKNVSEEVLRLIAMNRKFMKSYVVMRALVNNPRVPIDITIPLVARMKDRDLRGLSLNRNIPDVIRNLATRAIKLKQEATKPIFPGRH